MYRKVVLSLMLTGLILLFTAPIVAQDDGSDESAHPFLEMMALVPADVAEIETITVSYIDIEALMDARRGVIHPTNAELFNALPRGLRDLWFANLRRIIANYNPLFVNFTNFFEDMPQTVGFEWFAIDRMMTFGTPPSVGTILAGDFDANSIRTAFENREYEATEIEGFEVLCGPVGCENGLEIDFDGRDTSNPFGGDLGRQEPLALLDEGLTLFNSPDLAVVESSLALAAGTADASLLDLPAYAMSTAAALDGEGELLQVLFFHPDTISVSAEGMDLPEGEALPGYELVTIVDRQEEDQQVHMLLLYYADADNATAAAEIVAERLVAYQEAEGIDERITDVEIDAPLVFQSDDADDAVAIIAARYPGPTDDEASGMLLNLWFREILNRTFSPLFLGEA